METKNTLIQENSTVNSQELNQWKNDNHFKSVSPDFNQPIMKSPTENNIEHKFYLIKDNEYNLLGIIHIKEINHNNQSVKLEFDLDIEHSLHHIKEAVTSIIAHLFELNIHRIELETPPLNPNYQKLLADLGFKHEGIRREAFYKNGVYEDIHLYGQIQQKASTNLQNYLDYVIPHYPQPEFIHSLLNHLGFFNIEHLNKSKLYFLATFCGLLEKLKTDTKFIGKTLMKLKQLNWTSEQIKEALYSLERQLSAPLTEEEKIVHDLYILEQLSATSILKAISTTGLEDPLIHQIKTSDFQFFTSIGEEMGLERLAYTKKIVDEL